MGHIVNEGFALGQSAHRALEARMMPMSERTFYRYVESGAIGVISLELAKR